MSNSLIESSLEKHLAVLKSLLETQISFSLGKLKLEIVISFNQLQLRLMNYKLSKFSLEISCSIFIFSSLDKLSITNPFIVEFEMFKNGFYLKGDSSLTYIILLENPAKLKAFKFNN